MFFSQGIFSDFFSQITYSKSRRLWFSLVRNRTFRLALAKAVDTNWRLSSFPLRNISEKAWGQICISHLANRYVLLTGCKYTKLRTHNPQIQVRAWPSCMHKPWGRVHRDTACAHSLAAKTIPIPRQGSPSNKLFILQKWTKHLL